MSSLISTSMRDTRKGGPRKNNTEGLYVLRINIKQTFFVFVFSPLWRFSVCEEKESVLRGERKVGSVFWFKVPGC